MAGTARTADSWTVPEAAGSHQRFLPTFPGGDAAEADALSSLRKALETAAVDGLAPARTRLPRRSRHARRAQLVPPPRRRRSGGRWKGGCTSCRCEEALL